MNEHHDFSTQSAYTYESRSFYRKACDNSDSLLLFICIMFALACFGSSITTIMHQHLIPNNIFFQVIFGVLIQCVAGIASLLYMMKVIDEIRERD